MSQITSDTLKHSNAQHLQAIDTAAFLAGPVPLIMFLVSMIHLAAVWL